MKTVLKYLNVYNITVLLLVLALPVHATEKITFYHTDPVGTPLAMSDSAGQRVWEADYKPFGEEFSVTETPADNNRRFVGNEKDAESGLNYFGARYLSTDGGRFLAPDPVRIVDAWSGQINYSLLDEPQRQNTYAYALNNPNKYVDPDGLWPRRPSNRNEIDAGVGSPVSIGGGGGRSPGSLRTGNGGGTQSSKVKVTKNPGRAGKQKKLKELANDPKVSSADRGWLKNEQRHIEQGNRTSIRLPRNSRNSKQKGTELAHERDKRAKDGHGYEHSRLQDADLHKREHKIGGYK